MWLFLTYWQFSDVKLGHHVTEPVGLFDYKMHSATQITFHFANKWGKSVVSWLSCSILQIIYN